MLSQNGCTPLLVATFALASLTLLPQVENAEVDVERDPTRDWELVREGLRESKQSMCSFLLVQVSNKEMALTLDGVVDLFEQALDHMGRATQASERIRRLGDHEELIADFDTKGSSTVLEISENRRKLIELYREARRGGASDEELKALLERYFYKACGQKLATVIVEKSLYDAVLKLELAANRRAARLKRIKA